MGLSIIITINRVLQSSNPVYADLCVHRSLLRGEEYGLAPSPLQGEGWGEVVQGIKQQSYEINFVQVLKPAQASFLDRGYTVLN